MRLSVFQITWISCFVLIQIVFSQSIIFGYCLAFIEVIILLFSIITGRLKKTLFYVMVFCLTGLESFSFFTNEEYSIYNLMNFPYYGGILFIILSIVLYVSVYLKNKTALKSAFKERNLLVMFSMYMIITGIVSGLTFSIIDGFNYEAIIQDFSQIIIPSLYVMMFFVFLKDNTFRLKTISFLFNLMIAFVIDGWLDLLFGFISEYNNTRYCMTLPLASFFSIFIILFIFDVKTKTEKVLILMAFASSLFFQINFDSPLNGKSWLILPVVFIFVALKSYSRLRNKFLKYSFLLVSFAVTLFYVPVIINKAKELENRKLTQALSLFSGNIDSIEGSPQFRFLEFINIYEHTIQSPFFALFGRGIGGSISNNGYFGNYSKGTFSEEQFTKDKFHRMHESINVVFLKGGYFGLLCLLLLLAICIKNYNKSMWYILGFVWLLFFWGYSLNMLMIGVPSLMLAWESKKSILANSRR